MSKENLEQFMSKVADSEELQAKIGEEIDAEALIALGAECGCEFTAEELQDSAELSEEELGTVAGGAGLRAPDARTMVRRRTGTLGVSLAKPGGVCIKYKVLQGITGLKAKVYKFDYVAYGEDCG